RVHGQGARAARDHRQRRCAGRDRDRLRRRRRARQRRAQPAPGRHHRARPRRRAAGHRADDRRAARRIEPLGQCAADRGLGRSGDLRQRRTLTIRRSSTPKAFAMETAHHGIDLLPVIILLAGAAIAAPLAKRLGLGAVLGYLAAGLVIGPFGLRVSEEPADILRIAELGVVMFLFIIGLEMRPSRLWAMRRQIFGLGFAQVAACAALLTLVGLFTGFPPAASFVAGAGFVLTSTAIVMQLLEERGELASDNGQRMVAILLLEDLMLVPLLAAVAFRAPIAPGVAPGVAPGSAAATQGIDWAAIGIGAAAIAGLVLAGRFLLDPLFRLLATAQARE